MWGHESKGQVEADIDCPPDRVRDYRSSGPSPASIQGRFYSRLDLRNAVASRCTDCCVNFRQRATCSIGAPKKLCKLSTGEELLASRSADQDATFGLTVEGERRTLVPIIRDEAYRIAREVLRNAFRHAHARRIEAEILYDEHQLRLRVRDDGKGYASAGS
jgi:signal transduction histidine kinase